MQYTTNYNLPLPENTDIMDYTQFINAPNETIDSALNENKLSAKTANETANAASSGVAAADEKISTIQNNLEQYNIPQLKQEVNAIDARLETVEDDVNMFINPVVTELTGSPSSNFHSMVIRSGGLITVTMLFELESTTFIRITGAEAYYPGVVIKNTDLNYASLGILGTGNILNLPKTNQLYVLGHFIGYNRDIGDSVNTPLGVVFNGINTTIGHCLASTTTATHNVMFPMVTIAEGIY